MKRTAIHAVLAATLGVVLFAGCKSQPAETETAAPTAPPAATVALGHPKGSIKVGDTAVCTVCAARGTTHGVEEVQAVLDYKDKTYAFCSEAEKAEFISDPAKYAGAQ